MGPYRRLLLASEHTEQDRGADALAFALALRCGLPLAGVLPVTGHPELDMAAPQRAAQIDAEAAARRTGLEAAARAAGVELALRVRRGADLAEEIVAEARERGTDLLVVRRRGQRGLLANLLVGEMVSRVLARSPCSVLVVPREAAMWRRGVLVGVDPRQRDPSLPATAAALAGACGAALHLVAVVAHEKERAAAEQALALAQARADAAAEAAPGGPGAPGSRAMSEALNAATTQVLMGEASAGILAAAAERGADLLVVGRSSRSVIAGTRTRLGSIAREVTGRATCPVLVHVPSVVEAPR